MQKKNWLPGYRDYEYQRNTFQLLIFLFIYLLQKWLRNSSFFFVCWTFSLHIVGEEKMPIEILNPLPFRTINGTTSEKRMAFMGWMPVISIENVIVLCYASSSPSATPGCVHDANRAERQIKKNRSDDAKRMRKTHTLTTRRTFARMSPERRGLPVTPMHVHCTGIGIIHSNFASLISMLCMRLRTHHIYMHNINIDKLFTSRWRKMELENESNSEK